MAHHAKSGRAPGRDEAVGLAPAVKAHAKRAGLEQPVYLHESGLQPRAVVVVDHALACARAIARDVGRIRQNEVDGGGCHAAHDLDAVAMRDRIEGSVAAGNCGGARQWPPPFALAMAARAPSIEASSPRTAAARSPSAQLSMTACAASVWSSSASSKSRAAWRRRQSSLSQKAPSQKSSLLQISICSSGSMLS